MKRYKSILNSMLNAKQMSSLLSKSRVYKLKCQQCNAVYISRTQRNFDIRYKEIISSFRNKHPDKSYFTKYLLENKHLT